MPTSSEARYSVAATAAVLFLAEVRPLIDAELARLLPSETTEPANVHAAIRWSVFAGGKRLRPALLLAIGQTLGARDQDRASGQNRW